MDSQILGYYHEIEQKLSVNYDESYRSLVHPMDNLVLPIHNWYRFKEAYSPFLLREIVDRLGCSGKVRILDPFSGSGTTLLSAAFDESIDLEYGIGFEVNPFIHFMSRTKLGFYDLKVDRAQSFYNKLQKESSMVTNNSLISTVPELTTLERAYSKKTMSELLFLKRMIKEAFHEDTYEHDFFMLAFASILEPVSCMRKSGRALKIIGEPLELDVCTFFLEKVSTMLNDIENIRGHGGRFERVTIYNQDVRAIENLEDVDPNLIVFSPPYLNHFDYTEVYKVELWMLDFIENYNEFKSLRFNTLRSHSSLRFPNTSVYKQYRSTIIRRLVDWIDNLNSNEVYYRTIKGYIDDMYITLSNLYRKSCDGASLVCIVANSLFGSVNKNNLTPVATDLLISEIAMDVGFDVTEIVVARKVTRRGLSFPYGRESVIYMKKR